MTDDRSFDLWALNNGISPDAYTINGEDDMNFCALKVDRLNWVAFYSERGKRINETRHQSPESALLELKRMLLSDPTTRIAYRIDHRGPALGG